MPKLINATATGTDFSSAEQLPNSIGNWTTYLVTNTTGFSNAGVILPSNSKVDDVIEFQNAPGTPQIGFEVYADASSTLDGSAQPDVGIAVGSVGYIIRKTKIGFWQTVSKE
jgi:hypothetical protein